MSLMDAPVTVNVVVATALLFGFGPAFITRLLTLVWPADNPRRRELRAELERIPYRQRPIWVFEQIETTLFDGLPARARWLPPAFRKRRLALVERRLAQIGTKVDECEALRHEHQVLQAQRPDQKVKIRWMVGPDLVVVPRGYVTCEVAAKTYRDLAVQLRREAGLWEAERAQLLLAIARDEAIEIDSKPS